MIHSEKQWRKGAGERKLLTFLPVSACTLKTRVSSFNLHVQLKFPGKYYNEIS